MVDQMQNWQLILPIPNDVINFSNVVLTETGFDSQWHSSKWFVLLFARILYTKLRRQNDAAAAPHRETYSLPIRRSVEHFWHHALASKWIREDDPDLNHPNSRGHHHGCHARMWDPSHVGHTSYPIPSTNMNKPTNPNTKSKSSSPPVLPSYLGA